MEAQIPAQSFLILALAFVCFAAALSLFCLHSRASSRYKDAGRAPSTASLVAAAVASILAMTCALYVFRLLDPHPDALPLAAGPSLLATGPSLLATAATPGQVLVGDPEAVAAGRVAAAAAAKGGAASVGVSEAETAYLKTLYGPEPLKAVRAVCKWQMHVIRTRTHYTHAYVQYTHTIYTHTHTRIRSHLVLLSSSVCQNARDGQSVQGCACNRVCGYVQLHAEL
jgi:hypothetical protein